jgi:hypothetical protein
MEDKTMTKATAKSDPGGAGLRGRDRQQDRLRDRDPGQGIVPDDRGQDQPADKRRARQDSGLRAQKDKRRARQDSGLRAQKEAAQQTTPSPGQPAHGE